MGVPWCRLSPALGKGRLGAQESHPIRRLLPLRPLHPSLSGLHLLSVEAPDQSPHSPLYILHLDLPSPPQPSGPTPLLGPQPLTTHTDANTWALGPPEPEGHVGGAQRPALLGREGGGCGGAGYGGLLRAAPAGGAGWRHRAAPRGAGPRIRLLSQLLPPWNHVSEAGRGLGGTGAVRRLAAWGNCLPHHSVWGGIFEWGG